MGCQSSMPKEHPIDIDSDSLWETCSEKESGHVSDKKIAEKSQKLEKRIEELEGKAEKLDAEIKQKLISDISRKEALQILRKRKAVEKTIAKLQSQLQVLEMEMMRREESRYNRQTHAFFSNGLIDDLSSPVSGLSIAGRSKEGTVTSYNLQDIIADAELQGMGESENLNDFNEDALMAELLEIEEEMKAEQTNRNLSPSREPQSKEEAGLVALAGMA